MATSELNGSGVDQILTGLDISDSIKGSSLSMLAHRLSPSASKAERKKLAIYIKKWLTARGYELTDAGPHEDGSVIIKNWE